MKSDNTNNPGTIGDAICTIFTLVALVGAAWMVGCFVKFVLSDDFRLLLYIMFSCILGRHVDI